MSLLLKYCISLIVFTLFANGNSEELVPRLLVHKSIMNQYLVQHKDMIIKYDMYNVGPVPAVDVELTDNTFDTQKFDFVGGNLNARYGNINANTNVSHVVVVRPKYQGRFNVTSATVTYHSVETPSDIQAVYSSEPGLIEVASFKEYNKRFSGHTLDWLAFSLMVTPSLIIPLVLWYNSKSKYEKINSKNTKKHH